MLAISIEKKFQPIIEGAAVTFAHAGFKHAQMSDIAAEAGVALGTLYRYTKTKEALFFLALQRGFGAEIPELWDQLDDREPTRDAILEYVHARCVETELFPQLLDALEQETPGIAVHELLTVTTELYEVIDRWHLAVRMLDRSAREWPELARCFVDEIRTPLVQRLVQFLEPRCTRGDLVMPPDLPTAARGIVEICATFAMHRRFSPGGDFAPDNAARETALHFIARIFASPPPFSTTL